MLSKNRPGRKPVDVDPSKVRNRLREFREKHGYTQEQIAEYLGVEQGTISTVEREGRGLGKENWYKLADLFGVDPRILEGREIFCEKI